MGRGRATSRGGASRRGARPGPRRLDFSFRGALPPPEDRRAAGTCPPPCPGCEARATGTDVFPERAAALLEGAAGGAFRSGFSGALFSWMIRERLGVGSGARSGLRPRATSRSTSRLASRLASRLRGLAIGCFSSRLSGRLTSRLSGRLTAAGVWGCPQPERAPLGLGHDLARFGLGDGPLDLRLDLRRLGGRPFGRAGHPLFGRPLTGPAWQASVSRVPVQATSWPRVPWSAAFLRVFGSFWPPWADPSRRGPRTGIASAHCTPSQVRPAVS